MNHFRDKIVLLKEEKELIEKCRKIRHNIVHTLYATNNEYLEHQPQFNYEKVLSCQGKNDNSTYGGWLMYYSNSTQIHNDLKNLIEFHILINKYTATVTPSILKPNLDNSKSL